MKLLVFFFLIQNVFAEIKGNPQFNTFLKNNGLDKEEQHLAGGCQIYNLNGQLIRSYLGSHCFFEDDGSYLVSHHDSGALELRDKKNKIKWKLPNILAHHQISKNSDNNYLVMSSKVVTYQKALIRFDVFNIISPIDGKIIASFDTSKFVLEYFKETPLPLDSMWPVEPEIMGSKLEATHANTFFQISGLAKPTPNMNNGDYIITVIGPNRSVAILESKTLNVKKNVCTYTNPHSRCPSPAGWYELFILITL